MRLWEEGVARSNTTEARLIDRTTFHGVSHVNEKYEITRGRINGPLEPNSGIVAAAIPVKKSERLQGASRRDGEPRERRD